MDVWPVSTVVREKKPSLHPRENLLQRVRYFYEDRIYKYGYESNPLVGNPSTSSSILINNNDYLSIANHPMVNVLSDKQDVLTSMVHIHENSLQRQFEKRIASFVEMEDAILCQSGWEANVGLMQCIVSPEIPVYLDHRAHASLWEGVFFCGSAA